VVDALGECDEEGAETTLNSSCRLHSALAAVQGFRHRSSEPHILVVLDECRDYARFHMQNIRQSSISQIPSVRGGKKSVSETLTTNLATNGGADNDTGRVVRKADHHCIDCHIFHLGS